MTGFFGKVPSKGDFVTNEISSKASERLHTFFIDGMNLARSELQHDWIERYSTAPLWYFYLPPELVDDKAYIGAWMVSVDSVDRHFPFIALSTLSSTPATLADIGFYSEWLLHLEHLMLDLLEPDVDIESALHAIHALEISSNANPQTSISTLLKPDVENHLGDLSEFEKTVLMKLEKVERSICNIETLLAQLSAPSTESSNMSPEMGALAFNVNLADSAPLFASFTLPSDNKYSVWFSRGSDSVPSSVVVCHELPAPEQFIKFIIGFSNE